VSSTRAIGGRIPRNQWGLVRRALASVALKVLDESPGPPPDCTDAGWYQGNVKLIACEDERSAALYKAAINKVGEVYPGAKLAVCEAADIPSRPRARVWLPSEPSEPLAILSLLTRFNPKLPTEGGQGGENRARHHERGYSPEPGLLDTPRSPTIPGKLRGR